MRILGSVPRTAGVPLLAVLIGWYGGAKYGAPEFVMNTVDGAVASAAEFVGGFVNKDGEPAAVEAEAEEPADIEATDQIADEPAEDFGDVPEDAEIDEIGEGAGEDMGDGAVEPYEEIDESDVEVEDMLAEEPQNF